MYLSTLLTMGRSHSSPRRAVIGTVIGEAGDRIKCARMTDERTNESSDSREIH